MQLDVIEDFLSPQDFNNLQRLLIDRQFPWYLSQVVPNAPVLNNVQLVHFFYSDGLPQSPLYNKLEPVINKIKEKTKFALLVRAKANLITRTETILEHGYHIDINDAPPNLKTSILYLNTSNGYTKFKDGSVVTSECNRFVTFDGSTEHTGTTCTNEPVRIVLNLNYITN